jgi:hypothetical protein
MTKKPPRYLRRYTDLSSLIYLLSELKITLLNPETWDDTNDVHYLKVYREKKQLGSVLALCFTQANETYHHWRIFASGSSGVCIWFKRTELLKAVNRLRPALRTGTVTYLTSRQIRAKLKTNSLSVRRLPFLKRSPYKDEKEFRIIYDEKASRRASLDIEIPLSCIAKIKLSPWLHYALFKRMKRMLASFVSKNTRGLHTTAIERSTIVGNMEWKQLGESALLGTGA